MTKGSPVKFAPDPTNDVAVMTPVATIHQLELIPTTDDAAVTYPVTASCG